MNRNIGQLNFRHYFIGIRSLKWCAILENSGSEGIIVDFFISKFLPFVEEDDYVLSKGSYEAMKKEEQKFKEFL